MQDNNTVQTKNHNKLFKLYSYCEGRNRKIDFFRGAVMLLVFLHHTECPGGKYILAFHMPLFFILSGYLNSLTHVVNRKTLKEFIVSRFFRLIVPYYAFEFVNLVMSLILVPFIHNKVNLIKAIWSIILCINSADYQGVSLRLWFLPCMFIADIYFYIMVKILAKNKYSFVFSTALPLIVSFILSLLNIGRLPFTLDIAIMAVVFINIGYYGKSMIQYLLFKPLDLIKTSIMILSFSICVLSTNFNSSSFFMYINEYGNYLFAIIGAISGCIFATILIGFIFDFIQNRKMLLVFERYIIFIGLNTLSIFPLHLDILMALHKIINGLTPFDWAIKYVLLSIGIVPAVNIINMYFPFMLGIKKKK